MAGINYDDGVGVGDALGTAAIAGLALLAARGGAKGYDLYKNLPVFGRETAQSYFRGNKATENFLQTPSGKRLMRILESKDPVTARSNWMDLAPASRAEGNAAAYAQLYPEGIVEIPSGTMLVKYKAGAKEPKTKEPIYPAGGRLDPETNPVYNVARSLRIAAGDTGKLGPTMTTEVDLLNIPAEYREQAVQRLAANAQAIDRYRNLATYRDILDVTRKQVAEENSLLSKLPGVKELKSRIRAQRGFENYTKGELTAVRRMLRDDFPAKPETITELSTLTGQTGDEVLKRIKNAFSVSTRNQKTETSALNGLDGAIEDVIMALRTGNPVPFLVDPNYVGISGYVKNPQLLRAADYVPMKDGGAWEINSARSQLLRGRNYPTKEEIEVDEVRAMQNLPELIPGTPEHIAQFGELSKDMTKTKSLQRALAGDDEVVVDQADLLRSLGSLPNTRWELTRKKLSEEIFRSGIVYNILREAELRSLEEGSSAGLRKLFRNDRFLQQAASTSRGQTGTGNSLDARAAKEEAAERRNASKRKWLRPSP